ncbi:MBL fold metallo-hydrolase [Nocardioides sp. Iso805N]|uniref:MBL fold metallo-hydrolase n=1 Tax=Nocardioides sp. Iso805N TaxID=1283287 RepID=UPI00036543B3|nr:MBL fold metallo-hydrolase [Nocardioides sp. Iso805N]
MHDATLEFVGTATALLRLGPFTLLTDPNFLHQGQRAYLGKGLFARRRTEPSLQPAQLPEMDAVVLSHLHGDHFDRIARQELPRTLPILTTPQASRRLRDWGFGGAVPMTAWTSEVLERAGARLQITSVPGEHAPAFARSLLPPVMGSVLELRDGSGHAPLRIYITGDTLYRPWLREVVERCGPIDALVIHLGGTRILGMLVTMDAAQGADLVDLLAPRVAVPVHYDDYTVFRSSLADFEAAWQQRGLGGVLRTVVRGETVSLRP